MEHCKFLAMYNDLPIVIQNGRTFKTVIDGVEVDCQLLDGDVLMTYAEIEKNGKVHGFYIRTTDLKGLDFVPGHMKVIILV